MIALSAAILMFIVCLGGVAGFYGGNWYRKTSYESKLSSADEISRKILENAKKEGETIKREAKVRE